MNTTSFFIFIDSLLYFLSFVLITFLVRDFFADTFNLHVFVDLYNPEYWYYRCTSEWQNKCIMKMS